MTVPMDSNKENFSKESAQHLFNKNVDLENKRRKAAQARIPSDPNVWQIMRENYEAIILEDHDFSEQHDVEYALWQLHYRRIEELRAHFSAAVAAAGSGAPQNGKGPVRSGPDRLAKIRSQFKSFLSEATGFYHDLMLKIRSKYGLPLGYFSDDTDNQLPISKDGDKSSEVKKGLISSHRCLIYLGDLARYKGLYGEGESKSRDFAAATSYYMEASSLWPLSGNPHHQLAILAGYSNDELLSIYRYFRSLAVDNPFITARDNLIIAFEKNRQTYAQLLGESKTGTGKTPSTKLPGKGRSKGETRTPAKGNKREADVINDRVSNFVELFKAFITRFIRLNGILFTRTSLETFGEVFSTVKIEVSELLSSGPDEEFNFGSNASECRLAIVRMTVILIFTVHNVSRESENQSYADILQRSVLLQNAFTATFEFMGCIVERCNQLKDPTASYLLPGIMIFVEWLACHQNFAVGSELEDKQVNARSFFWNKCLSLLNRLLSSGYVMFNEDEDDSCFTNMSKYDESETGNRLALPEDFELRGFVPLLPAQLILDFSRKHSFGADGGHKEKISRVQRIVAAGKAFANIVQTDKEVFYFDSKLKKFVFGTQPRNFDDSSISSHLDPDSSGSSIDISAGVQMAMGALSNVEVSIEAEEDDEVIVFKPFTSEKIVDEFSSEVQVLPSFGASGNIDFGIANGVVSASHDNSLFQRTTAAIKTKAAFTKGVANGTFQYLQPPYSDNSTWPLEHATVANDLANLNLMENGSPQRSVPRDEFGISYPTTVSMSLTQFLNAGSNKIPPVQIPQARIAAESIVPPGLSADGFLMKQSSIMPSGLKKNPVSRPVRHVGPPPGFGSIHSKVVDESSHNAASKSENPSFPALDDYSWLDGYQLSSSDQSIVFSTSLNHMGSTLPSLNQGGPAFPSLNLGGPSYPSLNQVSAAFPSRNQLGPIFPSVSKANGSMDVETFPFPGKQVSVPHVQSENKGLWDYAFPEQMKYYNEQQHQFQKNNQQRADPTQPYHVQSLHEGRFFV